VEVEIAASMAIILGAVDIPKLSSSTKKKVLILKKKSKISTK
jgi:hypothetical protein